MQRLGAQLDRGKMKMRCDANILYIVVLSLNKLRPLILDVKRLSVCVASSLDPAARCHPEHRNLFSPWPQDLAAIDLWVPLLAGET